MAVWYSTGRISDCTVSGNVAWPRETPSVYVVDPGEMTMENVIIAFNESEAILCEGGHIEIGCCDLYGNDGGDELCGEDLGGNFSDDPLFCDQESGDYRLDAHSPCLPGNHPDGVDCGLIGTLGRGCGTLLTGACCFLDGSCIVAERPDCENQDGTYQGDGSTCEPNPCEPTVVQPESWGRVKALFR
jgi:hypothetical protein